MSLRVRVKDIAETLPEWAGRPLANIPYWARLGMTYSWSQKYINRFESNSDSKRESEVFKRLRAIVDNAYARVPFYRELYQRHGFNPAELRDISDWGKVPLVTKSELQAAALSRRCVPGCKGIQVNTGGTSGQPLEFMIDRHGFAREWAHMHFIWFARGYRPEHLKLTFRGKHFDCSIPLRYNMVHNELVVNANCSMEQIVKAVRDLPLRSMVRWVHGYPSLIAEFCHAIVALDPALGEGLRERLFGVLLGSEYPTPAYRSVIEETLSGNVVSWYGHSEMAVLARETILGLYESLPTYGYAEAVSGGGQGHGHRLICTSYDNLAHPFIRYDTGDIVEPVSSHGGSLAFRITEGRVGDFVVDRRGQKLSLTAIIFGRHHEAFAKLQHLQVRQDAPGRITLVVTPRSPAIDVSSAAQGFDLADLDIDWQIEVVDSPVRTSSGKIRLNLSSGAEIGS